MNNINEKDIELVKKDAETIENVDKSMESDEDDIADMNVIKNSSHFEHFLSNMDDDEEEKPKKNIDILTNEIMPEITTTIPDENNILFVANIFKKIFFQDNNSNKSTTAIQEFVKKIINSLDDDVLYKCNFFNVKHCKIVDGIIYTLISIISICLFGLIIYLIHSLYKWLSIYNNFKEAKKVFIDLESKV